MNEDRFGLGRMAGNQQRDVAKHERGNAENRDDRHPAQLTEAECSLTSEHGAERITTLRE